MKTSLKITVFLVALVVMGGCSAQKRAERRVRRAVELCPELVQVKAHLVDTVLTAPAYFDCTLVPLQAVLDGDTLYAATDHGTVVVSLRPSDSALRVGFVAAPQNIHYQDTLRYAQVVMPQPEPEPRRNFWNNFAYWFFGLGLGVALCFWVLGKILKNNYFTNKR